MAKKPGSPTPAVPAPPMPPTANPALAAAAAPPLPVAVPKLPFKIEVGVALPERKRIGNTTGEPSPYVEFMKSMPAPVVATDGSTTYASFFIPAEQAPTTVTDPGEREKVNKANARKTTNNIGAISRRIRKGDAAFNYSSREVVENGVLGVRVFRVAPQAAAEETAETQAA
jgi:hypothetical protein